MGTGQKIQVWIYRRGPGGNVRFLLLKTHENRGSFWQPVTGHVEAGESLQEAARREGREETGWSALGLPSPAGIDFEFVDRHSGKPVREYVFLVEAPVEVTDDSIHLDPSEHVAHCWISGADAFKLLRYDSNRAAINSVLQLLMGKETLPP
ncbi:MAG: NUDIX domain-containing protein [Bdellovibrionota bacterium]